MIRRLLTVLLVLCAVPAWAQRGDAFGGRANAVLGAMFTTAGNFGPPPYAADPFTCDATTVRTTYYNTAANTVKYCNGSGWQTVASGTSGIVGGTTTVTSCTDTWLLFNNAGVVGCDADMTFSVDTMTLTNIILNTAGGTGFKVATLSMGGGTGIGSYSSGAMVNALNYQGIASASGGKIGFSSNADLNSGVSLDSYFTRVSAGLQKANNFIQIGGALLTAATMTAETVADVRKTTHSYTWTNAMIVALGATTAGDIKVATLPAKEVVENAYVVIITPDSSANALTVACGRTSAAYIDYVVASDAKAAANTVYGDASGERGTNLTGYDLPSYTATTDVFCHFIKTTTNLNTVTASTGRVILETTLVP